MTQSIRLSEFSSLQTLNGVEHLSPSVQLHLAFATSGRLDPQEGLVINPNYSLNSLSKKDLISLYKALTEKERTSSEGLLKKKFKILIFDACDIILRNITKDSNRSQFYIDLLEENDPLSAKIKSFHEKGSYFRIEGPSGETSPGRPIRILACTIETERTPCGGIGAVVRGLNIAFKGLDDIKKTQGMPREKIRSLVPLYVKDKPSECDEARFLGTISHRYKEKDVISSVYKNSNTREYLIQPDPQFSELFNISLTQGCYSSNKTTVAYQRFFYIGSAFEATCLQYVGKSGKDRIHIAQADSPYGGTIAFPLIQEARSKATKQNTSFKYPATVLIMHHGVLSDKWDIRGSDMRGCGINFPKQREDGLSIALRTADKVVFVSHKLASRAISLDPAINYGRLRDLNNSNKVTSIRSGVDGPRFDLTNGDVYKELALKRTFDETGNETTDFVSYRQNLKQMLFDEGLIADPTKLLVAHIGRFDYYKGTDVVRYALDQKIPETAQFLVMGSGIGESYHVAHLKNLANTTRKNQLKIIDTLEQQKKSFRNTGVPIGAVIRAAADLFFFPSHAEALGLVGMEGLCTGAPIVIPFQDEIGFSTFAHPVGSPKEKGIYTLLEDANSFSYPDHKDTKAATQTLFRAIQQLNTLSVEDRNQVARRISDQSLKEFSWLMTVQRVDGVKEVHGAALAYSNLYRGLVPSSKPSEKLPSQESPASSLSYIFIPPIEPKIEPVPFAPWSWKNCIPRIYQYVVDWFRNSTIFQIFGFIESKCADFYSNCKVAWHRQTAKWHNTPHQAQPHPSTA